MVPSAVSTTGRAIRCMFITTVSLGPKRPLKAACLLHPLVSYTTARSVRECLARLQTCYLLCRKCEVQIAPKPSHWELLVTWEAIKAMRIAIAEDKPLRCPLLNHLSLVHEVPAVAVGVRRVRSRRLLPLGGCVRGFHVFIFRCSQS